MDLQSSEGKYNDERPFLVQGEVASPDRLHGQQQDQDIRRDREARIGVPVLGQVNTRWVDRLVPRTADGVALPDGGRGGGDHVREDDAHEGVAAGAKPALQEAAQVEQEDRRLSEVDGDFVEDLGDVEELECHGLVLGGEVVYVLSETEVAREHHKDLDNERAYL